MAVSIRAYDPFWMVSDLHKQMDSLFDDFYGHSRIAQREQQPQSALQMWTPLVDMRETENAYHIHAELPGIKKEDITLDLHGDVLTLSGERNEKKKEKNERTYRVERSYGKFTRSFTLPKNCDTSNISATHDNGVLELQIPKVAPVKPEARRIDIKGSSAALAGPADAATPAIAPAQASASSDAAEASSSSSSSSN